MDKNRGFEIINSYKDKNINLPKRQTQNSAGYDIEAAKDTIIPVFFFFQAPILVETGIKAYFKENEFLMLVNRSSNPLKKGLVVANSVGIVDSDYYNNPGNEGHIMFSFYNFSDKAITIKKGDRIGQAIFLNFSTTDTDIASGSRNGGFGSTM